MTIEPCEHAAVLPLAPMSAREGVDLRKGAASTEWFRAVDEGGALVGCVGLLRLVDGSARLKGLFVVTEQRGKGVAGQLVDAWLDWAKVRGFRVFVTNASHVATVRLVERRGFVHHGQAGRVPVYRLIVRD